VELVLRLFDRDGGVKVSEAEDSDTVRGLLMEVEVLERGGRGGDAVAPLRLTDATSTDCARFAAFASLLRSKAARCCDRIERFSSMGVKML
jgi:hypothetical protein